MRNYLYETQQKGQCQGKDRAWYMHKKDGYEAVKKHEQYMHATTGRNVGNNVEWKRKSSRRLQSVYHFNKS